MSPISHWASQVVLVVKNPPADAGDLREAGSNTGWGRSSEGGNGNPLQYSCLQNPMDRAALGAMVHKVTKSQTWLKQLSTHMSRHSLIPCVSEMWLYVSSKMCHECTSTWGQLKGWNMSKNRKLHRVECRGTCLCMVCGALNCQKTSFLSSSSAFCCVGLPAGDSICIFYLLHTRSNSADQMPGYQLLCWFLLPGW